MRLPVQLGLFAVCLGTLACATPAVLPPALFPVKTSWSTPVGEPIEGPLASDGKQVYVATRDGKLRALEADTGRVAWTRDFAPGSTVGAAADVVVVRQPDGRVRRVAPGDGRELWSTDARVAGSLAPSVTSARVYVAGQGVAALDAASGRLLWAAPGTPAVILAPTPAGSQLVVVEEGGTLRGRDADSGLPLWNRRVDPGAPPAVADNGRLYVGSRERAVLALAARDGARRWRWRLGADVDATPLVLGPKLIVASLEAVVYALDRRNGHMIWREPLPSRPHSAPLAIGAAVVVPCRESDLVGFAAKDGTRIATFRTPGEMRTPPLALGERLVVGLRFPWVVAGFQLDLTPRKPQPKPTGARRGRPGAAGASPKPGATPVAPAPLASPAPSPVP